MDVSDYSLWGGSAGARMAAWLGSRGTGAFGEKSCPRPAAVVMQYTGLSEVTGDEPPTYSCVGMDDGIAFYRTMQERTRRICHHQAADRPHRLSLPGHRLHSRYSKIGTS